MYRKHDRKHRWHALVAFIVIALASAEGARATFHLMQIQQVMVGACGDTTAQAIQLRLRDSGQEFVRLSQLVARDATGNNPVTLITFPSDVSSPGLAGDTILVTSAKFASINPTPASDFTMTQLIPASYLAAGNLTFERAGFIYWSISWGGASYTGSTTGKLDNDADGNFGPPFAGVLPTTGQGLLYQGSATSLSTNNAADYAVTVQEATFTNNAGISGTVDCFIFADGFESGNTTSWSAEVP